MTGGRWSRGSRRAHLDHRGVALLVGLLVVGLVVAGLVLVRRQHATGCAPEDRVDAADVPRVLTTGAHPAGSDARLRRLVEAARGWGLGSVAGGLGYDYGRFLTLAALPDGLAAWTKDNPDVAFLGPALRVRWGIAQVRGQHAWDLSTDTWFQLRLPARAPLQVMARRIGDGALRWCASVGTVPTRYGDPLGTLPLPGGDLLVLGAHPGGGAVTRLDGATGRPVWSRTIAAGADGSALLAFGTSVVVGGRASYDLAGRTADRLVALDPATGRTTWGWTGRGPVHVLGTDGDRLLVQERRGARLWLLALDDAGRVVWQRPAPADTLPDGAVRAGTVVLRTSAALVGLSSVTGRDRWRTPVPVQPQYFPYGFQLDAQPMLDGRHLLLGTTAALVSLDLASGTRTTHPLPVHGIDTTYWPYQVVVTPELLAVVTNTGAVVLRR